MKYRQKNYPSAKTFNVEGSVGKMLLTILWDWEGIVLIHFLEQGKTVKLEQYVATLHVHEIG